MDTHTAIALGRHTLTVAIMAALPMLAAGLIVGLTIALFQAVTSLQEQTLSVVPKVIAATAVLFFMLPWILTQFSEFALKIFSNLARYGGAL